MGKMELTSGLLSASYNRIHEPKCGLSLSKRDSIPSMRDDTCSNWACEIPYLGAKFSFREEQVILWVVDPIFRCSKQTRRRLHLAYVHIFTRAMKESPPLSSSL